MEAEAKAIGVEAEAVDEIAASISLVLGPEINSDILHCSIFEQLLSGTKFQKSFRKKSREDGVTALLMQ